MINKVKIFIVSFCLLLSACATQPKPDFIARAIDTQCSPTTEVETTTPKGVIINFKRYKNCFGYEDLIVIFWNPFNIYEIRKFVHTLLQDYLQRIDKKVELIQYENWGTRFFIVFEVKDK